MNYLLDRKVKRKKFFNIALLLVLVIIFFYFRSGIFSGLSYTSHKIFRPVLVVGSNIGGKIKSAGSFFTSKSSLYREIEDLRLSLNENEREIANYDSVLAENSSLKEVLGRKNEKTAMVLGAILSKPNLSPYDTLVIDVGNDKGLLKGDLVFALGNVPIGRVAEVLASSSKVVLFSSSGEKTQVVLGNKNIFFEATGRGGGNFQMIIPRDLPLVKGDQVLLPGINPYVLGVVETSISDPRDPFFKALLVSPVNIQEIKFVQVER